MKYSLTKSLTDPLNLASVRERCVKNVLDLIILRAIEQSPKYGYDVIGHIYKTFHVLLSPGTVYPFLDEMERHGILACTVTGKKRVHMLTKKGKNLVENIGSEYMKVHRTLNLNATED